MDYLTPGNFPSSINAPPYPPGIPPMPLPNGLSGTRKAPGAKAGSANPQCGIAFPALSCVGNPRIARRNGLKMGISFAGSTTRLGGWRSWPRTSPDDAKPKAMIATVTINEDFISGPPVNSARSSRRESSAANWITTTPQSTSRTKNRRRPARVIQKRR